jgi:hypothetical protein
MKKTIYMIIIILLLPLYTYSIEINEYEAEMVKFFDISNHSIENLGSRIADNGIAGCWPRCFTISYEDIIYICDSCKRRIVKYDLNFKYVGEIKTRNSIHADYIKISENNDIYLMSQNCKMVKMDSEGNDSYKMYATKISRQVFSNINFFPVDNNLFFYDPENKLRLIDEQGKILDSKQAKAVLQQNIITKGNGNFKNVTGGTEINKYIDENDLLCINDKVFHPDFSVFEKYNQFKRTVTVNKKAETVKEQSFDLSSLKLFGYLFIGYDKDNNSYWSARRSVASPDTSQNDYENIIIVYDNAGNIIDIHKNKLSHDHVSVSSAGDLYFMLSGIRIKGVAFYKIARKW